MCPSNDKQWVHGTNVRARVAWPASTATHVCNRKLSFWIYFRVLKADHVTPRDQGVGRLSCGKSYYRLIWKPVSALEAD
jgi:hypothetical protein